jgi:hypothetical protein
MAAGGVPVERLREYLRQLPPSAQSLLALELERAASRGDDSPGGEVLLREVRCFARGSSAVVPNTSTSNFGNSSLGDPNVGDPVSLFFRPLTPFLIDDDPERKYQGRMARACLEPLWAWIRRDLVPEEARTYCDAVTRALLADDMAAGDQLTRSFHDQVLNHIGAALGAINSDDKARRRLAGQIGTPNALDDAAGLMLILSARDIITRIEEQLPLLIRNLSEQSLDQVKMLIDAEAGRSPDLLAYVLVLVMGRLAAPWQLIRLAIKAVDSDSTTRIAGTSYALAVTVTLADIERTVRALKSALKRGADERVISLIKSIHNAVRGLRTELDMSTDSPWGLQLAQIRAEVSGLLKAEIESMPGRVRRLLRPRPSTEIARGATLDPDEVAEVETLIAFVGACRNLAGELAISEMTLRTYHEVQHYLDTGTQALLDGLRNAGDNDRAFRQAQVDAAIRFCAKAFGKDYAALITKAAEVAASTNSQRRAAAAKA